MSEPMLGSAEPVKLYHRAAKIRADGNVSALSFKRPRAIDLTRATWTIRDAGVTCPKCLALLQRRKEGAA